MCDDQDMQPEFYKIVHASLNTIQNLRIPPDFEKHIAQKENGTFILKGPSGNVWRVNLVKTEDGTYLKDGWEDFVRDHSLGEYEFLPFKYDMEMCFHVQIFDKSACEKEDSFLVKPHQDTVISNEIQETKQKASRGRNPKSTQFYGKGWGRVPGRRLPTKEELERAWKKARAFKSNLPYFSRCLSVSTVYVSYVMTLPPKFLKAHFPKAKTAMVQKNQHGKAWSVNFIPRTKHFCGCWYRFVNENQLEAGDICIFELVGKLEMCVHIFRCEIDQACST